MAQTPQTSDDNRRKERRLLMWGAIVIAAVLSGLVISTSWPREYAAQYCHRDHVAEQQEAGAGEQERLSGPVDCVSPDPDAKSAEAYQPENHWPDFWIALGTVWLFCGTVVLGYFTFKLWSETQRAIARAATDAENHLTLAFPPRLRVTNVAIWIGANQRDVPTLAPGEHINGFAWVVNFGREEARSIDNLCMAYWSKGPLPMIRPYHAPQPPDLSRFGTKTMVPGQIDFWEYKTVVPKDYTPESHTLYVMGTVFYRDRLMTRRAVLFCRRYDPVQKRFIAVRGMPDYESEE